MIVGHLTRLKMAPSLLMMKMVLPPMAMAATPREAAAATSLVAAKAILAGFLPHAGHAARMVGAAKLFLAWGRSGLPEESEMMC
jgi:ABC-type nitrate/sulfonate/bicarbonate transport system substrate-binding protein